MAPNRHLRLPLSVLLPCLTALSLLSPPVSADCYWPDGSTAYDMHECYGTDGADGLCCAQGDLCLLNHLCQESSGTRTTTTTTNSSSSGGSLYRGACNTPDWTQGATCPDFCAGPAAGGSNGNLTAAQPVGKCWGLRDQYFCDTGGRDGSSCPGPPDNRSDVFSLSGKMSLSLSLSSPSMIPIGGGWGAQEKPECK